MSDVQLRDLIKQVETFEIDEGAPSLSFAGRLARENGWSVDYADRVVQEYKRFAVLAVAAGHPVTPSEDVDQAWHLHLTYTHSYWERFCQSTLGRPLHHNPTEGGNAEHAKFFEWYANTLASYERVFGDSPPKDIWPHPAQRFARAGAGRWIDPGQYWLIPRLKVRFPRLPRWRLSLFTILSLLILVIFVGCEGRGFPGINPFDFRGKEFLVFYISLLVTGILASTWCRLKLPRGEQDLPWTEDQMTDSPYLAAALVNGPRGVVYTVIATMFAEGHLKLKEEVSKEAGFWGVKSRKERVLVRGEPLAADASEMERIIFHAADEEGHVPAKDIIVAGQPIGEAFRDKLREVGLVEHDPPMDNRYRTIPAIILSAVFTVGVIKLLVGLSRGRPVEILLGCLVVTGVIGFSFYSTRYLTPMGRKLSRRLLRKHDSLQSSLTGTLSLPVNSVALTTALFGMSTWEKHGGELGVVYSILRTQDVFSGGGNPGGGGCGGGCGGGGGGGDGGGGGCGGCGG